MESTFLTGSRGNNCAMSGSHDYWA